MPEITLSDYFYGDETERFSHFRIPRQLIDHPQFKRLSAGAKLLYGMLLNRMGLSARNGWQDNAGRVYIYYTIKEVCESVACGRNKAMRLLAELDTGKGIGLIERVKQGQGRPDRIFVKRITDREDTAARNQDTAAPVSAADFSDVQRSEKPTSRGRENRPLEVSKANPSYIDKNQTYFIHTNQSIYPPAPGMERLEMDRCEFRENAVIQNCFEKMCLTVKRIFTAIQAESAFRRFYSGQRRRKAVLSGQVCHLVAHQMTLVRGRSPLKTPPTKIRLTVSNAIKLTK